MLPVCFCLNKFLVPSLTTRPLVVHEMTTLPTVTLDEFKSKTGGVHAHSHKDGDHSHQYYEGAPRVGGPDAAKGTSATGHPGTTTDRL